ncbi:MAG: HEPN domain-containing protein [Phycisphaerae bacterium]
MSDSQDPAIWMQFATENVLVARMGLENGWLNSCLQNAQQAVEKALKALTLSRNPSVKRTYNIRELVQGLGHVGIVVGLTDDECELLDAIYFPSKYPPDSALPYSLPDAAVCGQCLKIAERVLAAAEKILATD